LDLGSGTGLILNKIEPFVGHIDAIEPLAELSKHIIKSQKINVININVFDFKAPSKYDIITLFGFMHYFNEEEAQRIYQNCFKWVKEGGRVIIKNQFGVTEDVTVSGFSKELNLTYHAQYRHIEKELKVLKNLGFINIDVVDIYPVECNRWENTHFYAIITSHP
jgi:SAM-dependent methyltransferase